MPEVRARPPARATLSPAIACTHTPTRADNTALRALREDAGDGPRQHVPGAGSRHAGVAALTQSRRCGGAADQCACALQDDRAAITQNEGVKRGQPVCLHGLGSAREKPARLPRMRREDPVIAPLRCEAEKIERVGIDDERLVAGQNPVERGLRPLRAPEAGPDRNDVGAPDCLIEIARPRERQTDEFGPACGDGSHIVRRHRHRDEARTHSQASLTAKTRRAGHSGTAADDEDVAEIAFVGGARARAAAPEPPPSLRCAQGAARTPASRAH